MQNQIPNNWQKMKLGDVLEMKYGRGLTEKNRRQGSTPVYGSSGIVGYNKNSFVQTSGIIIGRKGNVGSIFYSSSSFYPIDTVYYVDSLKRPGELKFYYYFLQKIPFKRIGSDVGVPGLNRDMTYGLDIIIPDNPNEQKRIASVLSSFDDKIELNNKIAKTLEETAQTIFKEWFVNNKDNQKGVIGDISYVKTGNRPSSLSKKKENEFIVPVYGAKEIIGYTNKILYDQKIIITGRVGTIGETSIIDESSWPSDNVLILIPKNIDYLYLLYFLVKRINFFSLNRGSSQPLIAQSDIENYFINLPDETRVLKFNSLVSKLFLLINSKQKENQKLAAMRDLLLPKLMKGEIRV